MTPRVAADRLAAATLQHSWKAPQMDSSLKFHPLTYLHDGDDVVVGRRDVDVYVALPPEGAELLRRLEGGTRPEVAAQWFIQTYGESVDMVDFIEAMTDAGFVVDDSQGHPENGSVPVAGTGSARQAGAAGGPAVVPQVRWRRLASALFSTPAWIGYGALVIAAVLACIDSPSLVPDHSDVFFVPSLVAIEVSLMLLTIPLTLVHELFHVLAGRRLGLRSRVRLANRFYFLVFETVMDGLVSVPRRQRYLPMLAGLLADILVLAGLICLAWLLRGPAQTLPGAALGSGLALALAFTTLPRMAWQGYLFLRTDGYYLVATVTGCQNLHEAAWWRVRGWASRHTGRRIPPPDARSDQFSARDLQVSRWYAPLLLGGYLLALITLFVVVLPLAWTFFSLAFTRVGAGPSAGSAGFVDAAVVLAITAGQLLAAGVLALRGRRRRDRAGTNG